MDKQHRCFGSTCFKIQVFYFEYYAYLGRIVTLAYVREWRRKPNLGALLFTLCAPNLGALLFT